MAEIDGGRELDRRGFLRLAGGAALVVPLAGALAACGRAEPSTSSPRFGPLPVLDDLTVASDDPIEPDAVLRVYQWKDYLSAGVLEAFERAHADRGVRIDVESFQHIDEAVARLQAPGADFDVVFPTVDVLRGMVEARLLRPLNHDLLPHLPNLWGWFTAADGPFYDPGQRYTTPYTVYTGGIGWRADLVRPADAPDRLDDPTDVFVDPRYRGLVGFYDSYRDALALGLQRDGVTDLAAATDADLAAAAAFLDEAVLATRARFTLDGVQEGLTEAAFAVHQAWSGDILTAPRYAAYEREDAGEVAAALRFRPPAGAAQVVGLDLTAIAATGRFPVAAHAFLDHLLRLEVAMDNFAWNGYQVPMREAAPEAFEDPAFRWADVVPPTLRTALVSEGSFASGQMLVGFGPSEEARWLDQWRRVVPS